MRPLSAACWRRLAHLPGAATQEIPVGAEKTAPCRVGPGVLDTARATGRLPLSGGGGEVWPFARMVVEIPPATQVAGGRRCWGQGSGHLPPCRAGAAQKVHCGLIVKPLFPLSLKRCRSAALSPLSIEPARAGHPTAPRPTGPGVRTSIERLCSAASSPAVPGPGAPRPASRQTVKGRSARSPSPLGMRRDDASRAGVPKAHSISSEDKNFPLAEMLRQDNLLEFSEETYFLLIRTRS